MYLDFYGIIHKLMTQGHEAAANQVLVAATTVITDMEQLRKLTNLVYDFERFSEQGSTVDSIGSVRPNSDSPDGWWVRRKPLVTST